MNPTCGCGRVATWEVEGQPHCTLCMEDATECAVPVLVRKLDVLQAWKSEQKKLA